MSTINMDDILRASLGETSSSIRATFKKTVNVKQYETESVEVSTTLELERELTGVERMLVAAVVQAQLEYEAYIQLYCKGAVTASQLESRRACLEQDVNMIKSKAESILNKPMDYIFDMFGESKGE